MSFLHTHSSECLKSELDLFSIPPTQTSIESSQWIYYKPVTSLADDAPVEFVIPGHGEDYLDLTHTLLSLRIRVESTAAAASGEGVASGSATIVPKVGPVNHLLHSMFNQIDVYFNQKLVSPANNAYAYRAYIEALLNYATPAKTSHLTSALWDEDLPGSMDDSIEAGGNPALQRRANYIQSKRALDLIGHLHCDVFNQDKFLINGVEVRVRLVRSKDAFCLMETNSLSKIRILDASLLVRRAKISPGVLLAHARMLSKTTAKYPLTRVEVPSRPLQPSFANGAELYVEAYHTLFSGTGIHFLNEGNSINREDYYRGYCLFAFDLTPDLSANCAGHWNLVKHGSMRLEVRFDKPLEATVNCIVYAEFDNVLEIDSSRQVIVDFSS
ncbi:PREDICTED: uncharacterized protein F54H12.2-like [Wasmannia auropunctata]|uniref:uncharacterized protein F54H12.2-like n=1 Tax=Wasmannia auropunctata TaxID=64793 RepID=UPI0005ED9B56|nr:PREDICTED: uncharacterized protein F54H12.2-like [Wasmannia auropunctata]